MQGREEREIEVGLVASTCVGPNCGSTMRFYWRLFTRLYHDEKKFDVLRSSLGNTTKCCYSCYSVLIGIFLIGFLFAFLTTTFSSTQVDN